MRIAALFAAAFLSIGSAVAGPVEALDGEWQSGSTALRYDKETEVLTVVLPGHPQWYRAKLKVKRTIADTIQADWLGCDMTFMFGASGTMLTLYACGDAPALFSRPQL